MVCKHERWEQIAEADGGSRGGCPICMSDEIARLRARIAELEAALERGREAVLDAQFIDNTWKQANAERQDILNALKVEAA